MEAALSSSFGRNVLGQTPFRIGRAPDNTLVISDPQASAHHVEIAPDYGGNGYQITDLNSTNGTFINEQRLTPNLARPLYSGDVIRIGTTNFTYTANESGASYPPTERASSPNYEPTVYASPLSQPPYPQPPAQPAYQQPPVQQPPALYSNVGMPVQPQVTPPPVYPLPAYPQSPGYPQPVSPQPGSFGQPIGYPPPQKKSRAGCWIAAIIILVLLVGGGSGAYYYFTRVNPNPLFTQFTSSPQQTLQTYCNALKSGDYQTAYNQFSTRAQSQISESDFAKSLQTAFATLGGLKDCTVGTVKQTSSTTATGSVTYTFGDGRTIPGNGRLVYESGAWKMDASNNINS